jgi:hypothetical protein
MINLVSFSTNGICPKHVSTADYSQHCGLLTSPRNRKSPDSAIRMGAAWAADNDCYSNYDPAVILRWLARFQHVASSCKWFNAPDVVCNAPATLFMFGIWQPIINHYGFPVAFTLQNGMEALSIPWGLLDAIFIGGDTAFKYSAYVRDTVVTAKRFGKWVHMGRVNTINRIRYAAAIGCDSFDGTNYTRRPFDVGDHLRFYKFGRQMVF